MNYNRFDLKVLISSLAAAAAVIGIFLLYERSVQIETTMARATADARLIRSLPLSGLPSDLQKQIYSELFTHLSSDMGFAYAQIDDGTGIIVSQVKTPGVVPPDIPTRNALTNSWLDRIDLAEVIDRPGFELRGALAGNNGGHYRIAFFEPTALELVGSLSHMAAMILPIFLLVPLMLFMLRREIRPIKGLANSISGQEPHQSTPPADNISGFVEQFNGFLDQAQHRIDAHQKERDKLVTTERFLNYRVVKLESILHALNSGLAIIDPSGKTTFCNELFLNYTALDAKVAIGTNPADWTLGTEFGVLASLGRSDKTASQQFPDIEPAHLPGVTLRLRAQTIRKPNTEEPSGKVIILQDVTGETLAQKSRGEFVAHVAHELKTPLNTLSLCAQSIQGTDGADPQKRSEMLNVITDEVDRLSTLISNLLSITQMEMGTMTIQPTRVKLSDLLNDAVSSVSRGGSAAGQRFAISVDDGIDTVQVDKPLFRIALNNLLTNAIKYSAGKGVVKIAAKARGDLLEVSVTDEGIGIPENERVCIFDKFKRGDSADVHSQNGHGLGLALTKDIAELHHGSISVHSEVGKGSTFTIALRLASNVMKQSL